MPQANVVHVSHQHSHLTHNGRIKAGSNHQDKNHEEALRVVLGLLLVAHKQQKGLQQWGAFVSFQADMIAATT